MSPRSLRLWSATALTALTATACGTGALDAGGGSASSGASSSTASAPPAPGSASPGGQTSQPAVARIAFGACTDGKAPRRARCGLFTAPLDYSDPSQGTIRMRVIKLPATGPGTRLGSLFTDPGGPGVSGVDFVEESEAMFASLNQRFDIVGFDPRGVREPDAVSCLDTAALDRLVAADPIPDDGAEKQTLVAVSRELADGCSRRSARLLSHVGTDDVVRDLDGMRRAVGDAKLTYLGFSYGTFFAERYAQRYPDRIRALVLDGDVDPSVSILDQVSQQADSLERSYREFLRRCQANGCALGSDPGATIDKVLSDLDAHPARALDGRLVGRSEALTALLIAMYDTRLWTTVTTLFSQAASGNVNGIQLLTDLYTGRTASGYDHQIESGTAADCLDAQAPTDVGAYDARAAEVQARDPHFGDAAVYGLLPCAFWPVHGPPAQAIDVRGTPTLLLVGATDDPATPYAWSQSVRRQIQSSVLITREGFGHTSYDMSKCIGAAVDAYLVDLTVPADGTRCPSD